jgi:hypothetical protein
LPTGVIAGEKRQCLNVAAIKPTGHAALDAPLSRGMTVMSGREAGDMRESIVGLTRNVCTDPLQAVVLPSQTFLFPSSTPALSRLIVAISDDIASG